MRLEQVIVGMSTATWDFQDNSFHPGTLILNAHPPLTLSIAPRYIRFLLGDICYRDFRGEGCLICT